MEEQKKSEGTVSGNSENKNGKDVERNDQQTRSILKVLKQSKQK